MSCRCQATLVSEADETQPHGTKPVLKRHFLDLILRLESYHSKNLKSQEHAFGITIGTYIWTFVRSLYFSDAVYLVRSSYTFSRRFSGGKCPTITVASFFLFFRQTTISL